MEMNTRLQVEHPVTEEITGQDLVEWQLRVASGEPLPKRQHELSIDGWAMEARLYAEDPATGFLPSTGRLNQFHLPDDYVRIDTGVEQGSDISPFYDPMVAKIIVHSDTRGNAAGLLADRLQGVALWPVKSNAGFLYRAASHPDFRSGAVTTGFIPDHADDLAVAVAPSAEAMRQAARELVSQYEPEGRRALNGFRLNAEARRSVRLRVGNERFEVTAPDDFGGELYISRAAPDVALVTEQGQSFGIALDRHDGIAAGAAADGAILSPMPGRVIAVEVAAGDTVTKGQKLVTLEAMKMEHSLTAPFDGTVAELNVAAGGQVSEGAVLARVEKA
jgi:3-methylcrotonyl-CoA carboxylase alpha subunit